MSMYSTVIIIVRDDDDVAVVQEALNKERIANAHRPVTFVNCSQVSQDCYKNVLVANVNYLCNHIFIGGLAACKEATVFINSEEQPWFDYYVIRKGAISELLPEPHHLRLWT